VTQQRGRLLAVRPNNGRPLWTVQVGDVIIPGRNARELLRVYARLRRGASSVGGRASKELDPFPEDA
jgi:hypothetical protein